MIKSLKDLGRYQLSYDESLWEEKKRGNKISPDELIWYELLQTKDDGVVYLNNQNTLSCLFSSKQVANNRYKELSKTINCKLSLTDSEGILTFSLTDYKKAFRTIKPKKISGRELSSKESKKLSQNGRKTQFKRVPRKPKN